MVYILIHIGVSNYNMHHFYEVHSLAIASLPIWMKQEATIGRPEIYLSSHGSVCKLESSNDVECRLPGMQANFFFQDNVIVTLNQIILARPSFLFAF